MFPRVRLVNCRDAPQAITIESFLGFQLLPCCQLFPLVARQECLSSCTTWPPITFKKNHHFCFLNYHGKHLFLQLAKKDQTKSGTETCAFVLFFFFFILASFISTKWHKSTLQEKLFTIYALGLVQEHSIPGPGDLSTEITSVRDIRGEMDRFNVVPNV